jgi:hypothetical protein
MPFVMMVTVIMGPIPNQTAGRLYITRSRAVSM